LSLINYAAATEINNNKATTKTELFANQNASKTPRSPPTEDEIYFPMRLRTNTYARLFAEEADADDDMTSGLGTPSSRSSYNSLKKSKSGLSVSSSDFLDFEDPTSCSEEMKTLQRLILETSQTNVTFNAVQLSGSVGSIGGKTDELPTMSASCISTSMKSKKSKD